MTILGLILIAVGVAGLTWMGRRQFYRTNEYGVETYRNFRSMWSNKVLGMVVNLTSLACFFIGLVVLALGLSS